MKYRNSLVVQSAIRTAGIVKEADGWYITLCCEVDITPLKPVHNVVGLDLGIKFFVVDSDGQVVDHPKHLKKYQNKLKRAPRCVSRKKKVATTQEKQ